MLLLALALIVAIYLAKRWRDERDDLALQLLTLQLADRRDHLDTQRAVWQQVAAVQRAARHAMHDAVTAAPVPPRPDPPAPPRDTPGDRRRTRPSSRPAMRAAGLSADEVQSTVRSRQR